MRSALATGAFWAGTGELAVKTFAQAALAMLTGDGLGVLNINWGDVTSVAGLAAIASVLMSVASSPISPAGSPSVVNDRPADEHGGDGRSRP